MEAGVCLIELLPLFDCMLSLTRLCRTEIIPFRSENLEMSPRGQRAPSVALNVYHVSSSVFDLFKFKSINDFRCKPVDVESGAPCATLADCFQLYRAHPDCLCNEHVKTVAKNNKNLSTPQGNAYHPPPFMSEF